jgi:hypothetical protein
VPDFGLAAAPGGAGRHEMHISEIQGLAGLHINHRHRW